MTEHTGQKTALPQHEPRPAEINFRLTDRDIGVMSAVSRCRYMRTNQIRRLLFPDNSSLQSCRRRLKYMYHSGLLGRVTPVVQQGHGSAETAYFLTDLGRAFLEAQGIEAHSYARKNQVRQTFLHHALDITQFRVYLELALTDHPTVALKRCTADFEMKRHTDNRLTGLNRYKLYDRVVHHLTRHTYSVFPDALIILKGKGEFEQYSRAFFLEIDRGTEGLRVIRDKIIGYSLYKKLGIFKKYGRFGSFTVLIQTCSAKRAANIRTSLTDLQGGELTWVTDVAKVHEGTILSAPIWVDHELKARQIVKSNGEKPAP